MMAGKVAAGTKYTSALSATYHHAVDGEVVSDVWRCKLSEWKASRRVEISASCKLLSSSYGIPDELRSEIWFYASGAHALMEKHTDRTDRHHATNYHNLSQMVNTKYYAQICKDYTRTFVSSDLPYIRADMELKLKRMLIAYANYNPVVGYAQGMNMICAFVLRQFLQHNQYFDANYSDSFGMPDHKDNTSELSATSTATTLSIASIQSTITSTTALVSHYSHSNGASSLGLATHAHSSSSLLTDSEFDEAVIEEKAFWCFAAVMDNIETLFQHKLSGYYQCVDRLLMMLKSEDRELFSFFETLDIDMLFTGVFLKWFTSLWAYPSFDLRCTQQLWDIWLVHGVSDFAVFIKFAFLLFQQHRQTLMTLDEIDIPRFCISSHCIMMKENWRYQLSVLRVKPLHLGRTALLWRESPHTMIRQSQTSVAASPNHEANNWFRIHITDTRAVTEKTYGEYQMCVQCEHKQPWSIWKRFSDFYSLYQAFSADGISPANNVVFPAKAYWYSSKDESLMKQRKHGLNEYLESLLMACHQLCREKKSSHSLSLLYEFVQYKHAGQNVTHQ